jgi:hypothetical protein
VCDAARFTARRSPSLNRSGINSKFAITFVKFRHHDARDYLVNAKFVAFVGAALVPDQISQFMEACRKALR